MQIRLELADANDVADLVALRSAVNAHLAKMFGDGYWCSQPTERGALFGMRRGQVYVAWNRGRVIASLTLSKTKPWAIDRRHFSPAKNPLYLTSMAVDPRYQGKGLGRQCIDKARTMALEQKADAVFLDAYDCAAGAGPFYAKCGFREVGRVVYRSAPLIYYEMVL